MTELLFASQSPLVIPGVVSRLLLGENHDEVVDLLPDVVFLVGLSPREPDRIPISTLSCIEALVSECTGEK